MVETTSLVGDDPVAASHATAGNAIPGLTVPLFAAMIADIAWWRIAEGLLFHRLKKRPLLFMAMKASGLGNLHRGPAAKVVAKSARDMARHLDALDAELARSGGPWTLGDAFSLADVGWVPIFDRLEEADSLHCFLGAGRRPHATAYWERLRARPSYREAIAGHVHPAVVRGTKRLRAAKQASPALRAALEPV